MIMQSCLAIYEFYISTYFEGIYYYIVLLGVINIAAMAQNPHSPNVKITTHHNSVLHNNSSWIENKIGRNVIHPVERFDFSGSV